MSLYTIVLSTTIPVQWSPVRTDRPLLAKVFMSYIEENLEREGKLPSFYRRDVDDTLTIIPNQVTAIRINFPAELQKVKMQEQKDSGHHQLGSLWVN